MSVLTDRVKAVLDNLKGSAFTNARALEIVEGYLNTTDGTADEKAQAFIDEMTRIIRQTVRRHAIRAAEQANQAAEDAAGDGAVTDL